VLDKLKVILSRIDKKLDRRIRTLVRPEGIVEELPTEPRKKPVKRVIRIINVIGDKITERVRRLATLHYFDLITRRPLLTVAIILTLSILLSLPALRIPEHIQSDVEIYLPPGERSVTILNEVREDWPTDMIMVVVRTEDLEITGLPVLREMSAVEESLNYNKTDRGLNDSVFYVLSISTIIKEINQSVFNGDYSIPDKERTEQILSQIAGAEELDKFIRDTNNDGINDTAVIFIAIPREADQAAIITRTGESIRQNTNLTSMTATGQPVILLAMQKRTVTEFMRVLPWVFILAAIVLYVFHRTLKLLIIALLPMLCVVGITFGVGGLLVDYLVMSPQIVLVAPLLVAFAIADSIYIANRFAEERDPDIRKRAIKSGQFVLVAIFLTSITTALGFMSLTMGPTPPYVGTAIKPLVAIGFLLALGILVAWILTVTVVPCLIILLNYRKRYTLKTWKGVGKISINNRKKLLVIAILVFLISVIWCLPRIKTSANYYLMAPDDEPSVFWIRKYSTIFEAGQPGMILARGYVEEYDTLKAVNLIQETIKSDAPNVSTFSVVNLMKMVKVNRTILLQYIEEEELEYLLRLVLPIFNITEFPEVPGEISYWDVVVNTSTIPDINKRIIVAFYERMSYEMRSVFINADGRKTLILADMPVMDIPSTRTIVNSVDKAIKDYGYIPAGSVSQFAGMGPVLVAANDLTIQNQLITMAAALILCFICLSLIYRSIKFATFTLLPVALVVSYEPLAFIGARVELSLITMMIASIIIGVGIDFCIHLTHHIRSRGISLESVERSTEAGGISFVEAVSTEIAALSAAAIVPILAVKQFVLMIVIMLLSCVLVALFIQPAIYTVWIRERKRRVIIE
jgi:hypothetical protein